jgi:flagellin-like protein
MPPWSRGIEALPVADSGRRPGRRAVSPVIGVILMVAITVILAAVIGAFVLVVGDRQETAPSVSFDVEQRSLYLEDSTASANVTQVVFTHAGGDTLSVGQSDITVNGNDTAVGIIEVRPGQGDVAGPMPDVRRTHCTNEPVPFESGDAWNVVAYDWMRDESVTDDRKTLHYSPGDSATREEARQANRDEDTDGDDTLGLMPLFPEDELLVVWESESGGKSQMLQRYVVQ